jgi:hypothetical protein
LRERFFEGDSAPIKEPPNRTDPGLLLALIEEATPDCFRRQIRFLPHPQRRPALPLGGLPLWSSAGASPAESPSLCFQKPGSAFRISLVSEVERT